MKYHLRVESYLLHALTQQQADQDERPGLPLPYLPTFGVISVGQHPGQGTTETGYVVKL